PFTQAEIDHAAKAFGPVIVPDLAVFVEVDDEAVAFIVALTNLNEAIGDFNGNLNPWNLARLLFRMKIAGVGSTRVPLMGVKKKFRNHPLMGAGLAMMAIDQLRQNGKRLGKTSAELGWILEDNKATNNIIRSVGGVHYKTHRIYEKALG
ncbi:MAG: dATP pyrophosphohydrolase, partial [Reyranellales bacterium]